MWKTCAILVAVGPDRAELGIELEVYLHRVARERESRGLLEERRENEHRRDGRTTPRVGEELPGQPARARRRLERVLDERTHRVARIQLVEGQGQRAHHRHQEVVEVVRDPAGERGQRLQLGALEQLRLEPALLRHVADDGDQRGLVLAPAKLRQPAEAHLDRHDGRVGAARGPLEVVPPLAHRALHVRDCLVDRVRLAHDRLEGRAEYLLAAHPVLAQHVIVHVEDPPVRAVHEDRIRACVVDGPERVAGRPRLLQRGAGLRAGTEELDAAARRRHQLLDEVDLPRVERVLVAGIHVEDTDHVAAERDRRRAGRRISAHAGRIGPGRERLFRDGGVQRDRAHLAHGTTRRSLPPWALVPVNVRAAHVVLVAGPGDRPDDPFGLALQQSDPGEQIAGFVHQEIAEPLHELALTAGSPHEMQRRGCDPERTLGHLDTLSPAVPTASLHPGPEHIAKASDFA